MTKQKDDEEETIDEDAHRRAVLNDAKLILTGDCDCAFHNAKRRESERRQ